MIPARLSTALDHEWLISNAAAASMLPSPFTLNLRYTFFIIIPQVDFIRHEDEGDGGAKVFDLWDPDAGDVLQGCVRVDSECNQYNI